MIIIIINIISSIVIIIIIVIIVIMIIVTIINFNYSQDEVHNNILIFEGAQNPLILERVYDVEWICIYDMRWYPFDSQVG